MATALLPQPSFTTSILTSTIANVTSTLCSPNSTSTGQVPGKETKPGGPNAGLIIVIAFLAFSNAIAFFLLPLCCNSRANCEDCSITKGNCAREIQQLKDEQENVKLPAFTKQCPGCSAPIQVTKVTTAHEIRKSSTEYLVFEQTLPSTQDRSQEQGFSTMRWYDKELPPRSSRTGMTPVPRDPTFSFLDQVDLGKMECIHCEVKIVVVQRRVAKFAGERKNFCCLRVDDWVGEEDHFGVPPPYQRHGYGVAVGEQAPEYDFSNAL